MKSILQPWPWWVTGPLIGLFVPLMVVLGKKLGISSNLKHACAMLLPTRNVSYLQYSVKDFVWSLWFFAGLFAGGLVGQAFLSDGSVALLPVSLFSVRGASILFVGGLLVGFGTRYAEGCTSGHSISGLSNLQKPALIATLCFFAGGLVMRGVDAILGGVL